MTPWLIICALHAPVCDKHHNRAAWPLPAVSTPMACIMAAQMAAPGLAVRPRRNVRYGDDRMVVVCVARHPASSATN